MLNAHPDLFVFNETHWIVNLYEAFGTAAVPFEDMFDILLRTRFVDGTRTTEMDVEAFRAAHGDAGAMTPAAFADAVGGFLAAGEGKTTWADKTPDCGYFASTLQVYWPECKIIHLIRDGANVVHSMPFHPGYRALVSAGRDNWCPLSLDYRGQDAGNKTHDTVGFAELWYRRMQRIRNEAERLTPGSYLEVRHEEVMASPATVLERIAGFVGLRHDEAWAQSAHTEINATKAGKPRPYHVLSHFRDHHLGLMRDLGYATEAPDRP